MDFSTYQRAIFQWIEAGTGHARVQAVAGSGKTTTLVEAARRADSAGLFLAFNKAIVAELAPRLAGTPFEVRTCHSAGLALLRGTYRGMQVNGRKYDQAYRRAAEGCVAALRKGTKERYSVQRQIARLHDLARATLAPVDQPRAARSLAIARGLRVEASVLQWLDSQRVLAQLYDWGAETLEQDGALDFGDMVHLPEWLGLEPPPWARYRWIFVDECQDLSAAQRALVRRLLAPGGRVLFVGDSNQAIYGFAGADCDSVQRIDQEFGTEVLPLSICYRCPTSHLDMARELVPEILPREGAPAGEVEIVAGGDISGRVQGGDLVLCRTTAPLVSTCMGLLAQGIRAQVKGRDIGRSLLKLVEDGLDRVGGDWMQVGEGLVREYGARQTNIRQLPEELQEAKLVTLADQYAAALALIEGQNAPTWARFRAGVEQLFTDVDGAPGVQLATVHRAKGLESERVFILRPDSMPLRWKGQTQEEFDQEINLRYVALTRAKRALFFVHEAEEF